MRKRVRNIGGKFGNGAGVELQPAQNRESWSRVEAAQRTQRHPPYPCHQPIYCMASTFSPGKILRACPNPA